MTKLATSKLQAARVSGRVGTTAEAKFAASIAMPTDVE